MKRTPAVVKVVSQGVSACTSDSRYMDRQKIRKVVTKTVLREER